MSFVKTNLIRMNKMKCSLHIQDPTDQDTFYLYEALIEQVMRKSLISWRGIFAFATREAVHSLFFEEPAVQTFLKKGEINLLVGIDAITTASALEELAQLNENNARFSAKVFDNPSSGLFHPKISHFRHNNGSSVLIVGSGNMTSGGLRKNIEAFTVITGDEKELTTIYNWDVFLKRHEASIKDISEEALEIARQNEAESRLRRRRKTREAEPEAPEADEFEELEEEPSVQDSNVLVAQVPAAGGRWHQVHYNKEIVKKFLHVKPNSSQRLFLREVKTDGSLGSEEPRPLIYSEYNKNYKVEIASRHGAAYPENNPPIIILKEVGLRSFRYMLLMPGDKGYDKMLDFTKRNPSIGKGVPRVLTKISSLLAEWPDCPI